jgi:hypothetical protein
MAKPSNPTLRNPDTDYESRDVPLLVYGLAALGLTALLITAALVIRLAYPETARDVNRQLTITPPEPRLQTSPAADLEGYLSQQKALLGSYGWIDRDKGIAREPIDEAMKRLARDGSDGFPKPAAPP